MDTTGFDNILKILLAGASLMAGAYLTALRSKIAATKGKNILHWPFYVIPGLVIIVAICACFAYWREISTPNWFAIDVLIIATVSSGALLYATKKFLVGRYQYKSDKLNPVVNAFSRNADKDNIKLLAGNLDFFGRSKQQIDDHPQFICLRRELFKQIQILCSPPVDNEDKMRYGKLITDLPAIQLRYYNPSIADLKVRGRIKTLNNVTRLLIYSKISPETYEALELDTADTNGALYTHLWELIWGLATAPSQADLDEYRRLYRS